jgi:hypothetical protein
MYNPQTLTIESDLWDIEYKSSKDTKKIKDFISSFGGEVTLEFIFEDAGIYLMRAHMTPSLVEDLRKWKKIRNVEKASHIIGMGSK